MPIAAVPSNKVCRNRLGFSGRKAACICILLVTEKQGAKQLESSISLAVLGAYLANNWRRGRDSNPRYGFRPYNGLANRRLQPLGHLSGREKHLFVALSSVKAHTTLTQKARLKHG
jgi:hypothetical protein